MPDTPKRIQKVLARLIKEGEEPIMAFPAIPQRYRDQRQMDLARVGVMEKASTWLVVTGERILIVRMGTIKNYEASIPLESLTDIEYIDEFHNNTLKLKMGEKAEPIVFFDEAEGMRFYRFVKKREWQKKE
jgi:hypothetical protein